MFPSQRETPWLLLKWHHYNDYMIPGFGFSVVFNTINDISIIPLGYFIYPYIIIVLQWRDMSLMMFQINNSTVCSTACPGFYPLNETTVSAELYTPVAYVCLVQSVECDHSGSYMTALLMWYHGSNTAICSICTLVAWETLLQDIFSIDN